MRDACDDLLTLSSHVNTESRYGTNLVLLLAEDWSARAEMTRPRVVSDLHTPKLTFGTTKWTLGTNTLHHEHLAPALEHSAAPARYIMNTPWHQHATPWTLGGTSTWTLSTSTLHHEHSAPPSEHSAPTHYIMTVSYTHLTLPTIYSV